jgi:hypothetical protein
MSRGVEAPLALTAIAVVVGNGWIEAMWNWMYTATHTGGSTNPFVASGNPAVPVTVGKGGDAVTGGAPGMPQVTITGTLSAGATAGKQWFIPNDSKIPAFTVGPSGANIPASVLAVVYKLFGTVASSGGSNGVTVW